MEAKRLPGHRGTFASSRTGVRKTRNVIVPDGRVGVPGRGGDEYGGIFTQDILATDHSVFEDLSA